MANTSLSDNDIKLYTDIISVGTAKLISKIISNNPEKLARHVSKEYNFGLAFTSVVNTIQGKKANDRFRQHDVRIEMPEFIKELRTEELSSVFDSLDRLGISESSNELHNTKKSGRKSVRDFKTEKLPGPKKSHKITELDNDIKKVLDNEKAINRIYILLLYSALIFRLMRHGKLISLYIMKINKYNKEKAFKACKSVFAIDYRQREFEEDFKFVSSISSSKYLKKKLEARADNWAYLYVKNHKPKDYYNIVYSGAYYFFV
jgi:hypothetical protein